MEDFNILDEEEDDDEGTLNSLNSLNDLNENNESNQNDFLSQGSRNSHLLDDVINYHTFILNYYFR